MLNIIDEFTHECLAIRVSRRLRSTERHDVVSDLFILRRRPRTHPFRQMAPRKGRLCVFFESK
jgi:hypothetical protein